MRNVSQMRGKLRRQGTTNQRLGFDVDSTGQWLVAGDTVRLDPSLGFSTLLADHLALQNGSVSVFAAEVDPECPEPVSTFEVAQSESEILIREERANSPRLGPVGNVNFTPDGKRLVTCAGARSFERSRSPDASDSDSGPDDSEGGEQSAPRLDSLQLWNL